MVMTCDQQHLNKPRNDWCEHHVSSTTCWRAITAASKHM